MNGLDAGCKPNHRHGVERKVEKTGRAEHHQENVVPRQIVGLYMVLAGREIQKARKNDKAHEQRQADLRHGCGKKRHADAVHGEARHKDLNDNGAPAGPDAGVGFAVIFAHDLINVGGDILLCTGVCGRGGGLVGIFGQGAFLLHLFSVRQLRQGSPAVAPVMRKARVKLYLVGTSKPFSAKYLAAPG